MTLGQRIAHHRKSLGISQETLGERLGVSRQAVSKWETGAAAPDMKNLIGLAQEFGISVSELTETAPPPEAVKKSADADKFPRAVRRSFRPALFALGGAAFLVGLFYAPWMGKKQESPSPLPPDSPPAAEEVRPSVPYPATDFALLWTNADGYEEFLELGEQESLFPFGTTLELTEPEKILDTDFGVMKHHIADCGAVTVEYNHITEDAVRESITQLSTIVQSVQTPRFIGPGSAENDVIASYGDRLAYCLKEEGDSLVPHDHYYAYAEMDRVLLFYVDNGIVTGVKVKSLTDEAGLFDVDNITRFPVVDGKPDFSLREEPQLEPVSDTRKVYIAFSRLMTDQNLTAEERYACRRDIFSLLPNVDWQEYMVCSGTYEEPDIGFFALMDWLSRQETYTASEILWLQMGCAASGLDGAYTDSYCHVLSRALFYDPVTFAKQLATDGIPAETMHLAVRFAAYDAKSYPVECNAAVSAIQAAAEVGSFTDAQAAWGKLLTDYLTTLMDEWDTLPQRPVLP